MQEIYTTKEYAKKYRKNVAYVRLACSRKPDKKGHTPKLKEGYSPKKIGSDWIIIKTTTLENLIQEAIQHHDPSRLKKRNMFVDLAVADLDVIVFQSNRSILGYFVLFNIFEFFGYHNESIGDQLLYLIYRQFSDQHGGLILFKKYLPLILNWLLQSGIEFFFNGDILPFPCEYCLYCGLQAIADNDKSLPPVFFCCKDHRSRFYKKDQNEEYFIAKAMKFKSSIRELANSRMVAKQNGNKSEFTLRDQEMRDCASCFARDIVDKILGIKHSTQLLSKLNDIKYDQIFFELCDFILSKLDLEIFANEYTASNSTLEFREQIINLLRNKLLKSNRLSKTSKSLITSQITTFSPMLDILIYEDVSLYKEPQILLSKRIEKLSGFLSLYRTS